MSFLSTEIRCCILRSIYNLQGYRAVGDPLHVYEVPLDRLKHCIYNSRIPSKHRGLFSISGGNWYQNVSYFKDTSRYKAFKKHFQDGVPWQNTDRFQRHAEKVKEGEPIGSIDVSPEKLSVKKLEQYYNYFDELYHDIKGRRYQRQTELEPSDDFANRQIHPALNEIQVCIGPEGTLMVKSGHHRFIIAKLLDLERIPVRTRIRHKDWQTIRDRLSSEQHTGTLSDDLQQYATHPEVADIIN